MIPTLRPFSLSLAALTLAALTPAPAPAQPASHGDTPPPDLYLPERYEPRGGGASFLTIAVPDVDKSGIAHSDRRAVMGFRLLGNISRNAYTPITHDGISHDTVAWRYVTEPVVDLRLLNGAVIAAGLPVVLQRGRVEGYARGHDGDTVGDGWIEGLYAWRMRDGYLGGALRITAPTGNEDHLAGNGALRTLAELISGYTFDGRWLVAGSLGYRKAFPARSDRSAGDELVWRVGARVTAWQRRLQVETAFIGAAGLDGPIDDRVPDTHLPVEWLFGLRWPIFSTAASFQTGLGVGLDRGEGAPLARFLVGIEVACALGECLAPGGPLPDRDNDGVPDYDDECLITAEDLDDFQDEDGCPEHDNDRDGVPDDRDKCPDEPEDSDGFADTDGCPDNDNDNDGQPDIADRCPNDPEDIDGYHDSDGCPDHDDDRDGIDDTRDLCPDNDAAPMVQMQLDFGPNARRQPTAERRLEIEALLQSSKEDWDGFEDDDGCPDLDHDNDGIPNWDDHCPDRKGVVEQSGCPWPDADDRDLDGIADLIDRCPSEAETINAFVDTDGCPDAMFLVDFQHYFAVRDDGQITLNQPLDARATPPAGMDGRQAAAWHSDRNLDGEAEHQGRLADLLAATVDQLNDPQIHLVLRGPAGPNVILAEFVGALTDAGLPTERMIPMCRMPLPADTPLTLSLCLVTPAEKSPGRADFHDPHRHRGLPQHLPPCPDDARREEHACML